MLLQTCYVNVMGKTIKMLPSHTGLFISFEASERTLTWRIPEIPIPQTPHCIAYRISGQLFVLATTSVVH